MSGATKYFSVQQETSRIICLHFESKLDVNSPETKDNDSIFGHSVGFQIIIIKAFDGLVFDIFERFHAFFVTAKWMDICEPGDISFVDRGFYIEHSLHSRGLELGLALHGNFLVD